MRTLYEKLSTEQLAKIKANEERYPLRTEKLISELERNYFLFSLTLEWAYTLHEILVGGIFGISEYESISDDFIKE